ncbi:MAG: protein adenylyltransferase SelO family protein, partial [Cyanobacteria bacterium P01_G01_bin.49]
NMSITGESFDYGPYAFIPNYDPKFTAAYFDYSGRYCYGNQPLVCRVNLEMLQLPLMTIISPKKLEASLRQFDDYYREAYGQCLFKKLGFETLTSHKRDELVDKTIDVLKASKIGYHEFFADLASQFNRGWREDKTTILENVELPPADWETWRQVYHDILIQIPEEKIEKVGENLQKNNPKIPLLRPLIESIWEAIAYDNNWQPFNELVEQLQRK